MATMNIRDMTPRHKAYLRQELHTIMTQERAKMRQTEDEIRDMQKRLARLEGSRDASKRRISDAEQSIAYLT